MFILQKAAAEYTTGYGAKRKTKPALAGFKNIFQDGAALLFRQMLSRQQLNTENFTGCLKTQSPVYCQ